MKKLYLFFISIFLFALCIFPYSNSMEKMEKMVNKNRELLIFLDDSEYSSENLGPTSSSLLSALHKKACPIIASVFLLRSIFYQYFNVYDKHGENYLKEGKMLLVHTAKINIEDWVIKDISDAGYKKTLYLLIPLEYLKKLNISKNDVESFNEATVPTSTELTLGLRVNQIQPVNNFRER
jgi:hypothetical protein